MKKTGIKLIRKETVNNAGLDFDRYEFEDVSQLSSKDVSIIVDFNKNVIEGNIVAYGIWYDLEYEECVHYLNSLEKKDIIRDFEVNRKKCDKSA